MDVTRDELSYEPLLERDGVRVSRSPWGPDDEIGRRLAQTRPDTVLPDLAMSLGALGSVLTGAERHDAAAAALREGLSVIAPFVERHAQAFGALATALRQDYLDACKAAGAEPDRALLERVARSLDDLGDD